MRDTRPLVRALTGYMALLTLLVTFAPLDLLSFPLTVSYVRAENDTDGRDMPEIPPLEGTAAARIAYGEQLEWWGELGVRAVADQENVDPVVEDRTPGYFVVGAQAGVVAKSWQITIGVENLLDRSYHEHLAREAMFAAADLRAGDEIPAPGRTFFVMARGEL